MKKILLAIFVCLITPALFAAYPNNNLPVHNSTVHVQPKNNITLSNNQQLLLYCLMNKYSAKQYQKLKGKKLTLAERIDFFLVKHKLEKAESSDSTGVSIGGFCLGFFLGPIGVLIAFLVKKNKNLRKWSFIGLGVNLIIGLILAIIVISSIGRWN